MKWIEMMVKKLTARYMSLNRSLRYNGIPLCARAVWRTMLV